MEKGDFNSLWDQMRGIQTKVLSDAIKDHAARLGVSPDSLGEKVLENIREQAKRDLEDEFKKRFGSEAEIERQKQENLKLIEAYNSANLLEKYRLGYTENTDLELRLERLFRIKDMILKDTNARVTNNDLPDKKEISPRTIALLTTIWYTGEDGKEEYRQKLIELGYLDPEPDTKLVLRYNGVASQVDHIPEYDNEVMGYFLSDIPVGEDGSFSHTFSGGKSLKLGESWLFASGATVTLESGSIQGKVDLNTMRGSAIVELKWRFLEEAGAGLDYQKYDIKRSFSGEATIEPAYSEPNKSRDQVYFAFYGPSTWDIAYTGKDYDPEKQEYFINTINYKEENSEWGVTAAYEKIME